MKGYNMKRTLLLFGTSLLCALAACSAKTFTKTKSETLESDMQGITKVVVELDTGSCTVRSAKTDKGTFTSDCKFKSSDQSKVDAAEKNISLTSNVDGETLYICFTDLENGSKVKNGAGFGNVTTDLTVTLPKASYELTVLNETGSVNLSDISGKFDIDVETGSVKAQRLGIEADSLIRTETGSIDISLASVLPAELTLKTDTGSIALSAGNMSIEEKDGHATHVGFDKTFLIDGKCTVMTSAEVGSLDIK